MSSARIITLILGFCFLASSFSSAQEIPVDSMISQNQKNFLVFPIVIKTPETDWGFGLISTYFFKTKKDAKNIRTSDIETVLLYTLNNQKIATLGANVYFPDEKYIFKIHNSYSLFPDKTWGIGNNTPNSNEEHYKVEQFYIHPTLLRKTFRSFFIGLSYEFQNVINLEHSASSILVQENIPGIDGGYTSGIGAVVNWDTRNHAFCPSKGLFLQVSVTNFSKAIRSDFDFTNYSIEVRKFFKIGSKVVLAFHGIGSVNDGDVPIRNLAQLGGSNIMRGYYAGRFADRNMAAAQSEIRFPIWWRFGGVAFYATGQVAHRVRDFSPHELKQSYGGGLRFTLNEAEKLNLRFDYGIGKKSTGIYVTVSEAF